MCGKLLFSREALRALRGIMSDPFGNALHPPQESAETDLQRSAPLAAVVILLVGCYLVLYPFIFVVLFAAVVCTATWPLYLRLRKALWGRPALTALAMTLLLIQLVIGPAVVMAASLTDNVAD